MAEAVTRAFSALGAVGIILCGVRQLPRVWDANPLDGLTIGAALLMIVVMLAARVFGERVLS